MVRETIGGSAFRVKYPATAKKDKEMDAIDKASRACQEIHDGSTTDELVKILLNLTFHSAVTSAIERFVFLTYIIASTLQVQTTTPPFSKVRKKTSKIPTRQINICKNSLAKSMLKLNILPGPFFFTVDD
jgi:hypothetical protein